MRTEKEMMETILSYANKDERVRIVMLEGSRSNVNIPPDRFQDYDITFLVRKISDFQKDDGWLNHFGRLIMLQKPEAMELFPPEILGFSYLMLFDDDVKMDLTLVELKDLEEYLAGDQLLRVLLDKDGRIQKKIVPTDREYHLQKPTAGMYDDCCNEFWNIVPYVVKGLCRREIIFAADHLNLCRQELLRMLSWQVGAAYGWDFSLGKNYKFLHHYIDKDQWDKLISTYRMDGCEPIWRSLEKCCGLFRQSSAQTGESSAIRIRTMTGI